MPIKPRECLIVSIILIVVLCIFHWNVIFGGKTLLSALYAFKEGGPCGYQGGYAEICDHAATCWVDIPSSYNIHNMLWAGELPLWNPYNGCGIPLAADWQTGAFFPLKWLFFLWTSSTSWDLFLLGRLFLAGFFTFLFVRYLGLGGLPSFVSAASYMLSGYFTSWINLFHVNVDIFIPLLLLVAEINLRRSGRGCFLFGALVVSLLILGGNPQPAIVAMILATGYYFWRLVGEWLSGRDRRFCLRKAVRYAVMVAVGVLLSSYALLPFIELFKLSFHAHQNAGLGGDDFSTVSTILFPHIYCTACFWGIWRVPYVGVVTILLACCSLGGKYGFRSLALFFVIYSIVFLSKIYTAPYINWVGGLPVLKNILWFRYSATFHLSAACLAGFGMEHFIRGGVKRISMIVFIAVVVVILIVTIYTGWDKFSLPVLLNWCLSRRGVIRIGVILIPCLLVCWSVFKPVDSRRWLIALFVTLLLLFELYLYMPKGRASRYELDRAPSFVSFLQQRVREEDQPFRVYGTGLLMLPQSSSVFGIQDIRTFSPLNIVYYQTLMDRLVDLRGLPPPYQRSLFASPRLDILHSKLLNLLNVKYVVTKEDIFKDKNDLKKRYTKVFHDTDCDVAVYENLKVMPRAFVARAARRFNSDSEIADSLEHASDKELRTTVLVRELPEGYNSNSKTNPESLPHDGASITHYGCRRVRVEAELDGPAYLFVSDMFYPGWKAIVDGKEKQIIRSNCAFRSVFLPPGAHTVEFVYRPLSFYLGAVLSCATLLLLVSLVFVGRRNR